MGSAGPTGESRKTPSMNPVCRVEIRMGEIARRMLVWGTLAMAIGTTPGRAQSFTEIDAAVREGIQRGIYPGAVVVIGRRDSLLYARGYGHFTWSGSSPVPSPDSTLWDVASITKVVSTTSIAMRLVDRKVESRCSRTALPAEVLRRPQERCHGTDAPRPYQRAQELRAVLPQGSRQS